MTHISTEQFMAAQSDGFLKDAVRKPDELLRQFNRGQGERPTEHDTRRAQAASAELTRRHEEHQRVLTAAHAHQQAERGIGHQPRASRPPVPLEYQSSPYLDLPIKGEE